MHHIPSQAGRLLLLLLLEIGVIIPPVGFPRCQIANHLIILHEGRGFLGEFGCIYPHKNLKGRSPSIYRSQGLRLVSGLQAQAPGTDVVTDKWYCGSVAELASSKIFMSLYFGFKFSRDSTINGKTCGDKNIPWPVLSCSRSPHPQRLT